MATTKTLTMLSIAINILLPFMIILFFLCSFCKFFFYSSIMFS